MSKGFFPAIFHLSLFKKRFDRPAATLITLSRKKCTPITFRHHPLKKSKHKRTIKESVKIFVEKNKNLSWQHCLENFVRYQIVSNNNNAHEPS